MFSFQSCLSFLSLLFSGLIAGLLFGYSCSVNIELKALPDKSYLEAMQSINSAIQNPVFFLCFMGLLVLLPLHAAGLYSLNKTGFYFLLASTGLYFIGVFAITIFGNVPLNTQLEQFNIGNASPLEIKNMRLAFELSWNTFHLIRTIAAVLSFACALIAVLKYNTKMA